MAQLYQVLQERTAEWRKAGFPIEDYPALSEILEWSGNPDGSGFTLRHPQFLALQVYWYLRLIEKTRRNLVILYHKVC